MSAGSSWTILTPVISPTSTAGNIALGCKRSPTRQPRQSDTRRPPDTSKPSASDSHRRRPQHQDRAAGLPDGGPESQASCTDTLRVVLGWSGGSGLLTWAGVHLFGHHPAAFRSPARRYVRGQPLRLLLHRPPWVP